MFFGFVFISFLLNENHARASTQMFGKTVTPSGLSSTCAVRSKNKEKTIPCSATVVKIGGQTRIVTSKHCQIPGVEMVFNCFEGSTEWLPLVEDPTAKTACLSSETHQSTCYVLRFKNPLKSDQIEKLNPVTILSRKDLPKFFSSDLKNIKNGIVCKTEGYLTDPKNLADQFKNEMLGKKLKFEREKKRSSAVDLSTFSFTGEFYRSRISGREYERGVEKLTKDYVTRIAPTCSSSFLSPSNAKTMSTILIAQYLADYGSLYLSPGDSGGPLYCTRKVEKDPKDTQWFLVGVTSSTDFQANYFENRWTPITAD